MSVKHASFTVERTYAAPIGKVWQAWADQASKAKWFVSPDEWESGGHTLDFQESGTEHVAGTFFDGLDRPEWREQGTNALLDALGKSL